MPLAHFFIYLGAFFLPALFLLSCATVIFTRSHTLKAAKLVALSCSAYAIALISEFIRHLRPLEQSWWLTEFFVVPAIIVAIGSSLHIVYYIVQTYTKLKIPLAPWIFYTPLLIMLLIIPFAGLSAENFYQKGPWYYRNAPVYTYTFCFAIGAQFFAMLPILNFAYKRTKGHPIFSFIRFLGRCELLVCLLFILFFVTFFYFPYPPMSYTYLGAVTTMVLFVGVLRYNLTPSIAKRYQMIMRLTPYAIMLLDDKQRVFETNDIATMYAKFKVGRPAIECLTIETNARQFQRLLDRLEKDQSLSNYMITMTDPISKQTLHLSCNASAISLNGDPFYYVTWHDKTREILRQQQIREMAYVDALTGLSNRTYFTSYVLKQHKPGTLVLCDLNSFKQVNDTYGHQVGDELLKQFASFFKEHVRPPHLAARLGGDEFAIFLNDCTETEVVDTMLRTIRRNCQTKPLKLEQGDIFISPSFGYAMSDEPIEQLEALLHEADIQMYKEKKQLKNV